MTSATFSWFRVGGSKRVGEEAGECSKMLTVNQREWYIGVLFFTFSVDLNFLN